MNPARRTTAATATALVLATAGGLLTALATPASAAVTCTSPVFKRQFFANTTFSGTPKKTDCDSVIDQNWGTGAPASGLPGNYFGVRWTVARDFGSGGPFTFTASGLDGIRVYLDGVRKIDLWKNTSTTVSKTLNLTIPQGKHTLRVDYVNWTGTANVKFAYTPRTSATYDKVAPLAPTGATWKYVSGTTGNTAALSWAANKEMDLAGYRVHRAPAGTGTWTRVGTTTSRTFSDTPPSTGQSYVYQIRAYDKAGNESAGTAALGPVPTPDFTAPAAPVLTVTSTADANNLSWTAPADAVAFSVFSKKSSETAWTEHPETTETNWSDTSALYGVSYDYKVLAYDAAWNQTYSTVVSGVPTIAPPQKVTATTPSYGAVISWSEPADNDTETYAVLRSPAPADGTRTWTGVNCRDRATSTDAAGNTVRSCTDYDGEQGATYAYVVKRKDIHGRWSVASQEILVTRPGDEIAPPAVTNLTAQALEYGVKLDWDPSPVEDLAEYRIYEQSHPSQHPDYIGTVDATKSETLLRMPADGEEKYYVVVAVDRYGNVAEFIGDPEGDGTYWSDPVSTVSVTELDLRPTTAAPAATACDLGSFVDQSGHVQVDPYCYGTSFTEADGYHVHRWDRATNTWVRLTQTPATTPYWTDTTAPAGTTVYYLASFTKEDGTQAYTDVATAVTLPSGS
ncbi:MULTISPECIES: PA14 domain-containing protein [unclassified Streptomyces]|uniref:PA14 domain-containing protein n=1 Tax=unclassified Streptomyces TaxID=2593676 RepID=UPI0023654FD8|nr:MULTISPECIES: PA14 domain-containing protein [unclassified Streptomyces]MDF3140684.1 PA14 domain-containing protein [Streptomyces sp. T21Q-yed]WDF40028.1 PA14 domain-containing protein [Streptomyces sp. T12]